ncbi:MAG: hypothetical protein CMJ54_00180 [Planctomycetaceae bacterium]|nr:hypothetical protein [Planctomycetaceae bacterium]
MITLQIIIISILGVLAVFGLVGGLRRTIGRPAAAMILIVSIVGILAAVDPDRLTTVARALGINRGTDLIVYLVTLVVFQGFVVFYLRLRKVRRELTLLVRHVAILEASSRNNPARTPEDAAESDASDP